MPTFDKTPETFMKLAFTPGTTETARANFNVMFLKVECVSANEAPNSV